MANNEARPCGHEWRNNDFDCFDCLNTQMRRYESALQQVLEGRFRYNMGDYETCAKNAARLALGNEFESPSDAEQLIELRKTHDSVLRDLKQAAFAYHVEANHKPSAFADCRNGICANACRVFNAHVESNPKHPEKETQSK